MRAVLSVSARDDEVSLSRNEEMSPEEQCFDLIGLLNGYSFSEISIEISGGLYVWFGGGCHDRMAVLISEEDFSIQHEVERSDQSGLVECVVGGQLVEMNLAHTVSRQEASSLLIALLKGADVPPPGLPWRTLEY